ncbi:MULTISPECIES: LPS O-antigen chain length determinant protein WzzB [unclassified Pseudomonas]|uniref:LPS O-antigen chain length determinant protein WzzB n=1 Tax=unclassified Pseudomonas TaxID=196821 RepID=UPI00106B8FA7|nr:MULTISPECIES: Wzz/FepE/Etk N-terminal domain-containing protein [unclassified Pseudomonas]KAA0984521.1 chain-length determining protein [Pseudomonas sp. ANT_J28]TFB35561.1 chain-length determining protein [Pseudomonas sp. F01002]
MQSSSSESYRDSEIDLQALITSIWRRKWLILGVAFMATLLAASYAFMAKPVFEAKLFLIPPTQNDIANFNYGRTRESDLTPLAIKDIYTVFLRVLNSESLRREFFNTVYVPSLSDEEQKGSKDALYSRFSKVLTVTLPVKDAGDQSAVTAQANDPDLASTWVQAYVDRAGVLAKEEMIKNISTESQVRARNLLQQINSMRESGIQLRQDSITKLREALRVAEAIGLEKPPIITGNPSVEVAGSLDGQIIYMRGSKALKAEIQNLEQRKSDDPFVTHLRDLQSKYEFYKSLDVNPSNVWVYREDGEVDRPDAPIKPRKSLILALGLISGLLAGIMLALILYLSDRNHMRSQA